MLLESEARIVLIRYRNSMDFSEHFNQDELSDVVLRLVIGDAAEDLLTGSRKRARSVEPDGKTDRLLFLHKLALYASPYFRSRLQRWEPLAADDEHTEGQGPSASASRPELVEHVEEGELEAVVISLKCLYRAGLPEATLLGDARLLLQVYRMADKYKVPAPCMEPIVAALTALPAEALDFAMLRDVYSMLPGLQEAQPLRPIMLACRARLVQLFGDIPAVIIDDGGLKQQFYTLPHAAVLAWSTADNLKVS